MSDSGEDDKTAEVAEQVDSLHGSRSRNRDELDETNSSDGEITSDGDDMVLTLDDDETEDSDE